MQLRSSARRARGLTLCATLMLWAALPPLTAQGPACAVTGGNRNGNYMVAGVVGDLNYRGTLTLDAYAPPGVSRPAAILIHGRLGDKSTHLTQLFDVLEHAG